MEFNYTVPLWLIRCGVTLVNIIAIVVAFLVIRSHDARDKAQFESKVNNTFAGLVVVLALVGLYSFASLFVR